MVDLSQLEKLKTDEELQAENDRLTAIEYLNSTDWYAVTQLETGTPIPPGIQSMRAEARLVIFGA